MKIIKPDFYDDFTCIADKCENSCCSCNWQIDVDKNTLANYEFSKDNFLCEASKKIHRNGRDLFIEKENGKCPFLCDNGLCEIVIKKGESFLGDDCRMFPRFINYNPQTCEYGLGLGCEESCRILLEHKEPIIFMGSGATYAGGSMNAIYQKRNDCFKIIQDRTKPFISRLNLLGHKYGLNFSWIEKINPLMSELDFIDKKDKKEFMNVSFNAAGLDVFTESEKENLLVYFVYKYFISQNYNYSLSVKIAFCILSIYMCARLTTRIEEVKILKRKIKAIVLYSREVEYSSENISIIMNKLSKLIM